MKTQRVVVTGSSGAIGSATCQAFLADGWSVVGLDRVPPDGSLIGRIEYFECDLSDSDAIAEVMAVIKMNGPIDALVNNAAVQVNKSLLNTTDDEWDLAMNTNVRSAFLTMREAHESLVESGGAVVNVSSVHAVATSANVAAYAASKGALVALTRAAAVELADTGVRCNAILPGAVDTPMLRDGLDRRPHPDGAEGNLLILIDRTPLKSVADPFEIAASIMFLADGTKSSFITGQAIVVDGGVTARLSSE